MTRQVRYEYMLSKEKERDAVTPLLGEVIEMHKYCRPAGSLTEKRFIREFLLPLGAEYDNAGNLIKQIGENPRVLWSSHTDTVHNIAGFQYLATKGSTLKLSKREKRSNCLGADDTAGVWLMMEMIRAGKEGLYIFHRGEEIGGIGSRFIAKHTPERLKGIEIAIAFDRRGTDSVITHQGTRCCSDKFAESLAAGLAMKFKADSTGTFTDTANYTDLVAECSNLSVGYQSAHSSMEELNLQHLLELRQALLALDTSKLVVERKPGEVEYKRYYGGSYGGWDWDGMESHYQRLHDTPRSNYTDWWKKSAAKVEKAAAKHAAKIWTPEPKGEVIRLSPPKKVAMIRDVRESVPLQPLEELVEEHPEEIADLLREFGLDEAAVVTDLKSRGVQFDD